MSTFAFTVEVGSIDPGRAGFENGLYEAGCNDALVVVEEGRLFLDFDREAPSFDMAVESASNDISRAGGHVLSVEQIAD